MKHGLLKFPELLLIVSVLWGGAAHASSALMLMDARGMGPLGVELEQKLHQVPGLVLTTVGRCRSTPLSWIDGSASACGKDGAQVLPGLTLSAMLTQNKPAYTIVVTGEANLKDSRRKVQEGFRVMTEKIRASGSRCIWVGPTDAPGSSDQVAYYDALRELADDVECAVVDLPLLGSVKGSLNIPDLVREMVNLGEKDPE